MDDNTNPKVDIGVAVFLIAVCSIVIAEASRLPPGTFEPLGSAPVPTATAGLIILLALAVILRAWKRQREGAGEPPWAPDLHGWDAVAVLALTTVYIAGMQYRLADFSILTVIYLVATIGLLVRFRPRQLPWVVAIALVTGFGCQYVFTRVFVVDLPGL